ncbi:MerR family transcriptional regulator [Nocardia sp. CDC160]|uniref:MerR family transcriptional regulator n=1 Tax=Nocardia sp. CDC160 TaxID=3112166 RepID=UPI002DBDD106|nr:MerR family transcriptional regulator [Nocardia sp. CDC160]MEC3920673.1 MerR family transcriptional regulator [Nocardia sp. CDC160]
MEVESEYTIDQLARAAETTVRSVRVYHERGLLPSPELRGRVGYYGADHLTRLHTISRLLNRGMKLNGIRELFEAWDRGDGLADVLGVTAGPDSARTGSPLEFTENDQSAIDAGNDCLDDYRLNSPQCYHLAAHLLDLGLPAASAVQLVEQLRTECGRIAEDVAMRLLQHRIDTARNLPEPAPNTADSESGMASIAPLVAAAASELLNHAFTRRDIEPRSDANDR